MNLVEIFISKFKNLPSDRAMIYSAGVSTLFNKEHLGKSGFEKSNSIPYVSLFQRMGLVDEQYRPNIYIKFKESGGWSKTDPVKQLREFYSVLFAEGDQVYKPPPQKIYKRDVIF